MLKRHFLQLKHCRKHTIIRTSFTKNYNYYTYFINSIYYYYYYYFFVNVLCTKKNNSIYLLLLFFLCMFYAQKRITSLKFCRHPEAAVLSKSLVCLYLNLPLFENVRKTDYINCYCSYHERSRAKVHAFARTFGWLQQALSVFAAVNRREM